MFKTLFLRFVYTGRLVLDRHDCPLDSLAELLALADRYEMDSLKAVVEPRLKDLTDAESVISMLSLADNCNADGLKVRQYNSKSESKIRFPLEVSSASFEIKIRESTDFPILTSLYYLPAVYYLF